MRLPLPNQRIQQMRQALDLQEEDGRTADALIR